ncbi:hypothetical protein BB546_23965 [Escherichia coli]|nr:hypothetical protein A7H85_17115 [Escherichia coli]PBS32440.1 hypothetical protein A7H86_17070 [Escherichia coli]PBS37939.1 hypothetical protein A7H87_14045 [Escherichia coli]PBS44399.1 hypothetical protein A7H88_06725 [Escherichia coli]PBS49063.1 hypothetical protein A7H89_07465 [Escherichia coli]
MIFNIFQDICYHLTYYWLAAADIPVASDNLALCYIVIARVRFLTSKCDRTNSGRQRNLYCF